MAPKGPMIRWLIYILRNTNNLSTCVATQWAHFWIILFYIERTCRELFFDMSTNALRQKLTDLWILEHLITTIDHWPRRSQWFNGLFINLLSKIELYFLCFDMDYFLCIEKPNWKFRIRHWIFLCEFTKISLIFLGTFEQVRYPAPLIGCWPTNNRYVF